MLHDEIIRRPSLQGFFQTSCPFVRFTLVYRDANSISILIYRDLENIIIDYKNDMVYRYGIVFSSLGASSDDDGSESASTKLDAESTKMFNDYYSKSNKDIEVVKNSDSYVIQKIFVSRLSLIHI